MSSKHLRKLGKNGPAVPAIGFGLFGFGTPVYGAIGSDDERFAVLDRAYELGARFWDSSEYVSRGRKRILFMCTSFTNEMQASMVTLMNWLANGSNVQENGMIYFLQQNSDTLKTALPTKLTALTHMPRSVVTNVLRFLASIVLISVSLTSKIYSS